MVALMLEEEGLSPGAALIQIETEPVRQICVRCKFSLIEGVYWRDTNTGWRLLKVCAYCRNATLAKELKRSEAVSADIAAAMRTDPLTGDPPRAYLADGQVRCSTCGSTTYREVGTVRSNGGPLAYVVEVICWMGGHTLRAVWRKGSPVRGRFPQPDLAALRENAVRKVQEEKRRKVVLADSMPAVLPPPVPPRYTYRGAKSSSMRKIVRIREIEVEGCDERCDSIRYIDPEDVNGPVYVRILHSPLAHNAYGSGTDQPSIYRWEGLMVDFTNFTLYRDGEEVTGSARPTPTEWKILRLLATWHGTIIRQEQILADCWGPEFTGAFHLLRVNMARLRAKLGDVPDRYIVTRPGIGYMMKPAQEGPGGEEDGLGSAYGTNDRGSRPGAALLEAGRSVRDPGRGVGHPGGRIALVSSGGGLG